MARSLNPITVAASKVAAAQAKADAADRAVERLRVAQRKADDAHLALDAARAELVALVNPPMTAVAE